VIILLYILAGFIMLAFAKALCFFTLDFKLALQQNGALQAPAAGSQLTQVAPNEILKPFCIYLQFSFLVMGMQGVAWPASLSKAFEAMQVLFAPASPQSLSLECVLPRNIALPVPVQVFLLTVAMPVLLMVALLGYETAKAYFTSKRPSSPIGPSAFAVEKERLVAQSIIVCFLFYPIMLRSVMSLFACVPLDDPVSLPYVANAVGSFWAADMTQQCYTGYHRWVAFGLGLPLLVLLVLALPVTMLGFILRHRKDLYSDKFRHFSFMFSMYRPKKAWWEVVVLLQTATLVAISVFGFGLGTYYSCLLLTAALAFTMVLHLWSRPYTSMVAGRTSLRGLACVFFTSFAALSFLPTGTVSGQASVNQAYAITAGAVVLILNAVYVVSVGVELVRAVRWTAVASLARKVMGVCCALRGEQQGGREDVNPESIYSGKAGPPPEREEA
jgi:hypothetical protein